MKANIKQLVEDRIDHLVNIHGMNRDFIDHIIVPQEICTLGELNELIDLIPDGAIEQAIHGAEDKETAETRLDLHYHV
jgi:hypothetical protein